jgi:hypothetical protein
MFARSRYARRRPIGANSTATISALSDMVAEGITGAPLRQ